MNYFEINFYGVLVKTLRRTTRPLLKKTNTLKLSYLP